jgi:hypothetical protein
MRLFEFPKQQSQLMNLKFLGLTLMIEAASTYETSVNFYHTTRRYNPEDSHLYT